MRIVMHSENDLEIQEFLQPEMVVDSHDPDASYSALQMFATSLALCSFSVLYGYGENIAADPAPIVIRVSWGYASDENRIDEIEMAIRWPGLPEAKRQAAERAAALCTLHRSLEHPPRITTRVRR